MPQEVSTASIGWRRSASATIIWHAGPWNQADQGLPFFGDGDVAKFRVRRYGVGTFYRFVPSLSLLKNPLVFEGR